MKMIYLIEELRRLADPGCGITIAGNAADEIERLYDRVAELEDRLEPFSHPDLYEIIGGNVQGDDSPVYQKNKATLTIGDFRRAAESLKGGDNTCHK